MIKVDYHDEEGLKDFLSVTQMPKHSFDYYLVEALPNPDDDVLANVPDRYNPKAKFYPWVELKILYTVDGMGNLNGRLLVAKEDGYKYLTNLAPVKDVDVSKLYTLNHVGSFGYELPVGGDRNNKESIPVRIVWSVEASTEANPAEMKQVSLSKENDDEALALSNLVYAGGNNIERLSNYIRYLTNLPNLTNVPTGDRYIELHYVWQGRSILVYACLVSNRPYMLLDRIDGVTDDMKKMIQQELTAKLGLCGYVITKGNEKVTGKLRWSVEVNLRSQPSTSQPEMGTVPRPQDPTLIRINEIFNTPCYQPGEEYDAIFSIKSKNGNHSRVTFRARIYNLNGENIKMPMFSLYVNTGYTSTWTNVYTTAWTSPVDGDTDDTVTDIGAISIIPIPGEEGRLYRAVYHPHTPTYSHAKIASKTSIPAFDID